jgi:hypothetical protein
MIRVESHHAEGVCLPVLSEEAQAIFSEIENRRVEECCDDHHEHRLGEVHAAHVGLYSLNVVEVEHRPRSTMTQMPKMASTSPPRK